jgi:hypothetical protein
LAAAVFLARAMDIANEDETPQTDLFGAFYLLTPHPMLKLSAL